MRNAFFHSLMLSEITLEKRKLDSLRCKNAERQEETSVSEFVYR